MYTIYSLSSDEPFITIKRQVIEIGISRITFIYYVILFSKTPVAALVPGRGVPGRGFKSDQLLSLLCAPSRAGKKLLSWRKGTNLTPGALSVTCLCHTRPSTAGTSQRPFSNGDRRGSGVAWRRRRHGQGQRQKSQPMISLSPSSPPPSILGEYSRR